jgi:hypothetical protein
MENKKLRIHWYGIKDVPCLQRFLKRGMPGIHDCSLVVPVTEENAVSLVHQYPRYGTKCGYLNVIDRARFRTLLPRAFSPRFQVVSVYRSLDLSAGLWTKAVSSGLNDGVTFIRPSELLGKLMTSAGLPIRRVVLEETVLGPQFEISGLRIDSQFLFFPVVRQYWWGTKIVRYGLPTSAEFKETTGLSVAELREQVKTALRKVKLNYATFCVEFRVPRNTQNQKIIKIIEINPRLGIEPQRPEYYTCAFGGKNPLRACETFVADVIRAGHEVPRLS